MHVYTVMVLVIVLQKQSHMVHYLMIGRLLVHVPLAQSPLCVHSLRDVSSFLLSFSSFPRNSGETQ